MMFLLSPDKHLSPRRGLDAEVSPFYTPSWISIAVAIRSLDPTLGLLKAGKISIAVRTLQDSTRKKPIKRLNRECDRDSLSRKRLGFRANDSTRYESSKKLLMFVKPVKLDRKMSACNLTTFYGS